MVEKKQGKVFVSIPMNGKSNQEIEKTLTRAVSKLESKGYIVINNYLFSRDVLYDFASKKKVSPTPLYFLGEALQDISFADCVYFCKGWEKARGCRIEHMAAEEYGKKILYEEEGV